MGHMATSSIWSYPYNSLIRNEREAFPFLTSGKETKILKEESKLVGCAWVCHEVISVPNPLDKSMVYYDWLYLI